MRRMLKFDFYKSIKSISTWIILLCVVVFSIASLTITYISKTEGELPDVALKIGEQTIALPIDEMTVVDWCVDSISGDFLMLFVIVFAVLFTCNDYATGFVKNIYNNIDCKWHYILAKIVVVSIFTIITIVATYSVTIIFNLTVVNSVSFGNTAELLKFTLYKAFLLVAYGSVGMLVSFALRKSTVSLILCMGYSFMFANLIYTGINQGVRSLGISETFDIQKYTIVGNTISLTPNTSSEQLAIVLIVCSTAIVASFVISSMIFSKRDI